MTAYLVRRLLALIPVMAVVVTIVFLLIHLIPGDPVAVMLGPDATPAQIEATRAAPRARPPAPRAAPPLLQAHPAGGPRALLLPRSAGDAGPVGAGGADAPADGRVAPGRAPDRGAVGHRGRRQPGLLVGPSADAGRAARRLHPRVLAQPQLHLPLRGATRVAAGGGLRVDLRRSLGRAPLHGPARGLARLQPVGADRAHRALVHGRGPPAGLHPDRPRQGPAQPRPSPTSTPSGTPWCRW